MGQLGIKLNVENKDEPILFFELFFDDSLVDLIVDRWEVDKAIKSKGLGRYQL